ncbi:hypothetical protein [Burkholderia sp. AU31280]|uniref:hypothetical protein n=1 Tax=Burkholderia sp. AU31280 TaxID=2015353 RepID=UPI001178C38E|nr:hypothetical protein [Burkholderia sp. AU31280]
MSPKSPSELISDFLGDLNNSQNLNLRNALSGDYSEIGKFSPIGQYFIDDNELLFITILPSVAQLLDAGEFGKDLVEFQKNKISTEIENHYTNLNNELIDQDREIALINCKEKILENLSLKMLEQDANSVFRSVILPTIKTPSIHQSEKNYFYAYLLGMAYEKISLQSDIDKKYNRTEHKENLIYQYYKNIDIDITKHDQQFRKYDLYSVDDDSEIFVALPSRIIDKKNNIQFIVEMQKALLQMLVDSKESGHIEDLALLARSQNPIESDQRISLLLGTYQMPVAPKIQDIYQDNFPHVVQDVIDSRLISEDKLFLSEVIYKFHEIGCGDSVWVFSNGNSVEFEEILENPEILDDCVVTQMIHLEYVIDDGRVKISHIDHEYLFYSYEEFDRRLEDYNQRAGAKKRIKTFKVDRSKLPLVLEDGTFSLYTVLDAYFIRSYFLQEFLAQGCGLKDVVEMVRQAKESNSPFHS